MKIEDNLKDEAKKYVDKINLPKIKNALVFVFLLLGICCFVLYFRFNGSMPKDVKNRLDSLEARSFYFQNQQKFYDSLIQAEVSKINELDIRLNSIKEKTVIVKEYYNQIQNAASAYTSTQVDSFFRDRYKY